MTAFQKGVLIIASIVILGMIMYPPYKEARSNRGYASFFKYPATMKQVPKYDYANEFYNFSDEQVRVPDKVYVFSSVNPVALSLQLAGILIISSVLWVLGKASYINRNALVKYSRFNLALSAINIFWFIVITLTVTLPFLLSVEAVYMSRYSLFQLVTFVTPIMTVWALHPHAGTAPRLLAVMLNALTTYFMILMHTVFTLILGWFPVLEVEETIELWLAHPHILFLVVTGAINAVAVLISRNLDIKKRPAVT